MHIRVVKRGKKMELCDTSGGCNDGRRWIDEERHALIEIRNRLKTELEIQAPFPEGYN